ncbi:hypothetical protein HYC85_001080 [Camellia sinensis]|uniref:Uncharacterized protein n=1 Tax=Camellia sinensis TaxID=4442 RepID=A0A7J7I5K4_CAMSI|nr:hypothetical protein HYC85_001080 [Camellia sinensis]
MKKTTLHSISQLCTVMKKFSRSCISEVGNINSYYLCYQTMMEIICSIWLDIRLANNACISLLGQFYKCSVNYNGLR